jgi:hypothetical protein
VSGYRDRLEEAIDLLTDYALSYPEPDGPLRPTRWTLAMLRGALSEIHEAEDYPHLTSRRGSRRAVTPSEVRANMVAHEVIEALKTRQS